jgi:hypothetical protein
VEDGAKSGNSEQVEEWVEGIRGCERVPQLKACRQGGAGGVEGRVSLGERGEGEGVSSVHRAGESASPCQLDRLTCVSSPRRLPCPRSHATV